MRNKSPGKAKAIVKYVDTFFEENLKTPSIREIEAGTGISRPMVQQYLVDMDEKGVIRYKGSNIITEYIKRLTSQNTVRLPISGAIPCGEPQNEEEWKDSFIKFPTGMLGKGEYFVLLADGDSMTDAGIDDGDYVIVRKTKTAGYGSITNPIKLIRKEQ